MDLGWTFEEKSVLFSQNYDSALRYFGQAEANTSSNPKEAFVLYGKAAQAAAWAAKYSPRECKEKAQERNQMFNIMNVSSKKRSELAIAEKMK